MPSRRIGELLVAEGLISEAAISRALGYQRVSGDRVKLGSILLGWDLLAEESLLTGLGKLHRCPTVSGDTLLATAVETARLLPAQHAIRMNAIPYGAEKGVIRVAFVNPSDIAAIDEVAALTGRRVVPGVTTEARLFQAHQKFYGRHIPLEYRPILQKLQRRTTTGLRTMDFRQSDLVETERASTETGRAPAGLGEPDTGFVISVEPARPRGPDLARDQVLAIPDFPPLTLPPLPLAPPPAAAPPAPPTPRGTTSLRSGEDSLSDWVGRALSSFTGDPAPEDDSPAGVSDPSLFGREAQEPGEAPGALADIAESLPPTNAFLSRASEPVRLAPLDAPPEAHTRGIPASIPPFRRSTDPRIPHEPPASRLEHEDELVAGMWRPAPSDSEAEPNAPVPSMAPPPPSAVRPTAEGSDSTAADASGGPARSREEIADSILQGPLELLPRVLLLGAGRTGVTGWRGRGPALSPETVVAIRIPNSEISVFSSVQQSGIPHFGAIDRAEWPGALAAIFGSSPPDCAVFPIRMLDGVAAFLYADRLGGPMQYEDFAIVARAAASAANVLSRFLLRSEKREKGDRSSSTVRSQ